MANIARLGVALGLNTAEFQSGLKGAMAGLEKVKDAAKVVGVAILAAGTAMAYMTKKSIDNMDKLAKQAQMAGVTTESLSALAYAADLAGVSQDTLVLSMAKLSKGMSDAAMNTGEALKGFNALNIDYKNLESTDEAMLQISERFAGMADGANKTAIAMSLFGRSGAQLIPLLNGGRDGVEKLRAEAEKLGLVIGGDTTKSAEQFNDSLTQLGSIFTGLANQIATATLPLLNSITQALFNSWIESDQFRVGIQEIIRTDLPRWLDNVAYGFAFTADIIGNVINIVRGFIQVLQHAGDVISYVMANVEYSMAITDQAQESALAKQSSVLLKLKQNEKDFDQFQKEKIANAWRYSDELEAIQNQTKDDAGTGSLSIIKPQAPRMVDPNAVDKLANMLKEASLVSAEFDRERQHAIGMLQIKADMAGLANNEKRVQEAVNDVLDATSAKLQEISDKREKAAGQGADSQTLAEYDRQALEVERLGSMYEMITRQMEEATIASQMTFSFGWNKAFAQFSEDAQNYATVAADMFGSLVSSMNSAIDNFVDSGKLSFSEFAESVIKDIIKIQLKMQASKLLQMGIKFAIGAFSAGATPSGGVPGGDVGSYSTFASGGTITGPSIVGENGPELFIPGRSGAIIPNNNLNDSMGGGGVTYNGPVIQNMQAIDTQSGIQFLAKNKMTIWSMNQSANRSIPAGR
jgi:lambda family phage tail tape measure protein